MTHFSTDYQQGIKDEQERIIKALFTRNDRGETWIDRFVGCGCCAEKSDDDLIALIKGEQK